MTGKITNEELVLRVYDGQEEAYGILFQNFRPIFLSECRQYRDRMPIYDEEDYIQEGNILIWRILEGRRFKDGAFEGYIRISYRRKLVSLYRNYCLKNPQVIHHEEGKDGYDISILGESAYAQRYREEQRARSKAYYQRKKAERIAAGEYVRVKRTPEEKRAAKKEQAMAYYERHREEINARKRERRAAQKAAMAL